MAGISGEHSQAGTGRVLTYWATFDTPSGAKLFYVAVIRDGLRLVGQHEATLRIDPTGVPAPAVVRMDLLKHIDLSTFGEGTLPSPTWIGWRGGLM